MANSPKLGLEHKLVVGTNDVSYLPTDATPQGTAVLNGPVFVGLPIAAPIPKAVLNVGPIAPPLLFGAKPPLVTPFSMWVDGLSNQVGIHLHTGIRVQTGMNYVTGQRVTTGLNKTNGINITSSLLKGRPVVEGGHVLSMKKTIPFDIPHPNKKGWRLRHVCLEGPEVAVYCRGTSDGIINLPSFWDGFINKDDITITLTSIGSYQQLFVKEVKWSDKQVIVGNNLNEPINCHYNIIGRRLDDDLTVEYEGESHVDYPGGNEGFSFDWENDNMERLVKEVAREKLEQLDKE